MTIDITAKLKKLRRLRKAGEVNQSIALCKKLLNRHANIADLHYELGLNYKASAQFDPAIAHFNQAIKLGMRKAAVFVDNAASLNLLSRYGEAETMARAAVTLAPDNLPGMRNLITALLAQGKYQEAAVIGEQLVQHSPGNASDHVLFGRVMINLERYDDAVLLANKAIELDAKSAEAHYLLSRVYLSVQQWEKSLTILEQAIAIAPGMPDYMALKANLFELLGRFEEAFTIVAPMMNKPRPRNGLAVLVYARCAKRFGKQENAIRLLEELVSERNTYRSMRQTALSLLGTAYESLGNYDRAFAAIDSANKALPLRYSDKDNAVHTQKLQDWFTRERITNLPRASSDKSRPIFIVGMPRSGTSLTEKILSRHPDVHAGGETLNLQLLLYKYLPKLLGGEEAFPECLEKLTPAIADQAASKFLSDMGAEAGKRITEKRPMNFEHLGAIAMLFPEAKIIHCTRNPLDTALSCYFTQFISALELGFSQDLELIGNYYNRYKAMMAHWHEVLPQPIFDFSYEALSSNPETEIRRLLEYCDLPFHEACLNPEESTSLTRTASYNQVRRPINTQSIDRWKLYEKQLQPLREMLEHDQSAAA
ncbi:MAG: sulfotransferase [Gammaproteobacteria bacterium]